MDACGICGTSKSQHICEKPVRMKHDICSDCNHEVFKFENRQRDGGSWSKWKGIRTLPPPSNVDDGVWVKMTLEYDNMTFEYRRI